MACPSRADVIQRYTKTITASGSGQREKRGLRLNGGIGALALEPD